MTLQKFIEDARRLCEAEGVEPGPWYAHNCSAGKAPCWCKVVGTTPDPTRKEMDRVVASGSVNGKTAEFIAASRTLLPKALEMLTVAIETIEQLSMGHGVPLGAAMAAPPERYRIMAKELNEMLQERTVFARDCLAALKAKAKEIP